MSERSEAATMAVNQNETPTQVATAGPVVEATRPTVAADQPTLPMTGHAEAPTRATVPAGDMATVPMSGPGDAEKTVPMNGGTSSIRRATGTYTRLGRTRANASLPPDTQTLDFNLQQSRPSVLAGLGYNAVLPPGVRKLVEEHGTDGRYAVEKPLAQGGMGAVLLIKDGDFQRPAAMKVMLARFAQNPEAIERFLAEAQVTAQLEHPNIVPIHDLGIMEDGTVFFTMKFIEGFALGAVAKRLRSEDPAVVAEARREWSDERILTVMLKVLDGLGYAHHRGVVHRDLKPDNIMLGSHGEVLIVDWGIAKVLGHDERGTNREVVHLRGEAALSQTQEGVAMGTLHYMPPEQARGDLAAIDHRSDIYSLGATIFELLTGQRPVTGTTAAELLVKVSQGDLVDLKQARPDLDPDLVAIINRSMALTPTNRYQDCAAFAADMRSFLAGQAVVARQRNLVERVGAWIAQHRRQVAIGAGVAAALTVTALAGGWWSQRAAQARADGLLGEARTAATVARWDEAKDRAVAVLGIRADPEADRLRVQASEQLAIRASESNARIAAEANAVKARELTVAAQTAAAALDWATARDKAAAALEAAPSAQAQDLLAQAKAELTKGAEARLKAQAGQRKATGDAALARAKALGPLAAELPTALAEARAAYAQSAADGFAVPGVDLAIAELGALQAATDSARADAVRTATEREQAAQRRRQADEALVAAEQAITAGQLDAASDHVAVARKLEPADERANALRERLLGLLAERTAERAAAAARTQAQATAAAALAQARTATTAMRAAMAERAAHEAEVTQLSATLANADVAGKAPLFAARAGIQAAATKVAEQWALSEAKARAAMDALIDQPTHADAVAARDLLILLYQGRLADARARGVLPEVAAFSNLLRRLGNDPDAGIAGKLTLTGPAGVAVVVRRLVEDGAGRFIALDPPVTTLTLPATDAALEIGRYELRGGAEVASIAITGGGQVRRTWAPVTRPNVPGATLRWVAAESGFWLAEHEVTIGDWQAFLADPANFAKLAAGWRAYREQKGEAALYPRNAGAPNELDWVPDFSDAEQFVLTRLVLAPKLDVREPLRGISRPDAQAYCMWLSQRSGRKVRLPTLAEWRFTANAGDDRRLYPWGPGGDPALATSAVPKKDHPPTVGSSASDIGPFGHRDLAGSVREWVADAGLVYQARIAGGGWTDEDAARLRSDAVESLPPDATFNAIGVRILVEP